MKTKVTKLFCLFIAILLLSATLAPVALANSKIYDARSSILRVVSVGDYDVRTGTAFVIAQSGQVTTLVTNLHVVSGQTQVLIIPNDIQGSWIPATVTFLPDGLDLVLLTTTTGLANRPIIPLSRANTSRAAQTVFALGFPGASDVVLDDWHLLPSTTDAVTTTSGTISNISRELDDGVFAIQSDVNITYGHSGGPLLNERGEAIGVNTWILTEGAYQNAYSIHIDYIIDACNDQGIKFVRGGNFFMLYWWIFAIAGGVVILGAMGLIIGLTGKKKSAPAYAAAGAAPMGAAPAGYPQPGYAPQPAAAGAARQLFSTKGQLAGNSFPIHTKLAIGRDPQRCQVAYPSDAKGISAMHCEVMIQQGGVYLTDKGSTYGTFLAGGQKLAANQSVMLQPGATFYLADPVNEFKIT